MRIDIAVDDSKDRITQVCCWLSLERSPTRVTLLSPTTIGASLSNVGQGDRASADRVVEVIKDELDSLSSSSAA